MFSSAIMVSPLSIAVVLLCTIYQAVSAPMDANIAAAINVGDASASTSRHAASSERDVARSDFANVMIPKALDKGAAADDDAVFYRSDNSDGYVISISRSDEGGRVGSGDGNAISVAGGYGDDENGSDRAGNIDNKEGDYDDGSGDEDDDDEDKDHESDGEDDENYDNDSNMRDNANDEGDYIDDDIERDIESDIDIDGSVGDDSDDDDDEDNNDDRDDNYYDDEDDNDSGNVDSNDNGDGDDNGNGDGDENSNDGNSSSSDDGNDDDTVECRTPPGEPSLRKLLIESGGPSRFFRPGAAVATGDAYVLRHAQIIVDGDNLCRLPVAVPLLLLLLDNKSGASGPSLSEALQVHASYAVPGKQVFFVERDPETDSDDDERDDETLNDDGDIPLHNNAALDYAPSKLTVTTEQPARQHVQPEEESQSEHELMSEEEQERQRKQQMLQYMNLQLLHDVFEESFDYFLRSLRTSLRHYGFVLGADGSVIVPRAVALLNMAKPERGIADAYD